MKSTKNSVIQGGNAYEVKRLFLKDKCKKILNL